MVTREAGTQENQRICCPSNFRTEDFVQFEEMKLPGNRGNQAGWSFPASYSVKCASLAYLAGGSGTPGGGGRGIAVNSRPAQATV